jgi:heme/copper-type cytochrome/quinol oxidase subunit 1
MHLSAGLRYSAVGAAAASLGIIVVAHAGFSATYWLQSGAPGWTIYPPLSALPQAIAESSVNPFEYSMYIGLVTAALVAGVVALGALVAGLICGGVRLSLASV